MSKKICHSEARANEVISKLKALIERWEKGVTMCNQGLIHPDVAIARFAKLTDEIAAVIVGYEDTPEVNYLMGRWFDGDWSTEG